MGFVRDAVAAAISAVLLMLTPLISSPRMRAVNDANQMHAYRP
jgi:hypothetical protein